MKDLMKIENFMDFQKILINKAILMHQSINKNFKNLKWINQNIPKNELKV